MMQMLKSGGIEILTDNIRTADSDNPRGYLEFEAVKELEQDNSWLPECRGKAVKMISMLLYQLPPTESYRVLFMERDLDEVLQSQETMLRRLNRESAPHDQMAESYRIHLDHLNEWLKARPHIAVLRVAYKNLVEQTSEQVCRICEFLNVPLNVDAMLKAVDPELYRNRS